MGPRSCDAYRRRLQAYILGPTAGWNQSIYDAYNNVLRGTTEAMSAAIGGVDSLTVAPFDETYRNPDEASRGWHATRQMILRDEALARPRHGPGAGSYYRRDPDRRARAGGLEADAGSRVDGRLRPTHAIPA